ncbi:MAG: UDP-3-O-acyl-N-acetylglucosamine deacetylase [Rhodospirillales bacterium]
MDGLPESLKPAAVVSCQRTLKSAISCVGVGLHTGQRVNLALHPAAPGTGIVFRRTDLGVDVPARYDPRCRNPSVHCHCVARSGRTPASAPSNIWSRRSPPAAWTTFSSNSMAPKCRCWMARPRPFCS